MPSIISAAAGSPMFPTATRCGMPAAASVAAVASSAGHWHAGRSWSAGGCRVVCPVGFDPFPLPDAEQQRTITAAHIGYPVQLAPDRRHQRFPTMVASRSEKKRSCLEIAPDHVQGAVDMALMSFEPSRSNTGRGLPNSSSGIAASIGRY